MTPPWVAVLVVFQSVALFLLALAVLFLYRQWGGIVLQGAEGINTHHGLRLGVPAPPISGVDIRSGQRLIVQPRRQVLVFATPGCPACEELSTTFRDFTVVQDRWPLTYVLDGTNSNGLPDPLKASLDVPRFKALTVDGRAHDDYEVQVSPFVIVIDEAGRVASKGLIGRLSDLVQLIVRAGDDSMGQLRDDLIDGRVVVEIEEESGELITRPSR